MAQFEIYADRGGKFRWRLKSRNGEVVGDGTVAYKAVAQAQQAVAEFVAGVTSDDPEATDTKVAQDKAGRWRWAMTTPAKADSGQSYAAERTAREAFERLYLQHQLKRFESPAPVEWKRPADEGAGAG